MTSEGVPPLTRSRTLVSHTVHSSDRGFGGHIEELKRPNKSSEETKEKTPCLQTLTKARRHLSRSVPSAILWRMVESIRLDPTFGVCSDAKQARQRATPTLMPTKAKVSSGMRRP